jgi:hypothetical protein
MIAIMMANKIDITIAIMMIKVTGVSTREPTYFRMQSELDFSYPLSQLVQSNYELHVRHPEGQKW